MGCAFSSSTLTALLESEHLGVALAITWPEVKEHVNLKLNEEVLSL